MLNEKEINAYKSIAVEIFKQKYPFIEVPKFVVCPEMGRTQFRERVFRECDAEETPDSDTMSAETVAGKKDLQIIIYQKMMRTEECIRHTLWHELGHLVFGLSEDYGIDISKDTPVRNGYGIVNEFMAEYIAHTVNDYEAFTDDGASYIYMIAAFDQGANIINPYYFSLAMAKMLGDYSTDIEVALENSMDVPELAIYIMEELYKQTEKPDFWKVDNEFLEKIGRIYNKLFHECFQRYREMGY